MSLLGLTPSTSNQLVVPYFYDVCNSFLHTPPPSLSLSTDLSEAIVGVEPFECVEDGGNPYLGSEVTMRCTAEGDPLPRVAWFYNEVTPVLEEGDFTNVIYQQDNRTLIINPLRSVNLGRYHCQSENVIGQKSSNSISLGFRGMMYKIILLCSLCSLVLALFPYFNTECFIYLHMCMNGQ